jgi:pimeloyl-ACP methyl ester carboxylesterase
MAQLSRDGVTLAYAEAGSGEPPLLFVHGLACDRSYFAPQVEHFSRQRRTLAVDLRGHGASDAPRQDYTVEGFADDLAWLCGQLKLEQPIVVGHSLGGLVGLTLAARYPELPTAVIMVDMPTAALVGPPTASDPRSRLLTAVQGDGYPQAALKLVERMFLPTDDPERRSRIVEGMTSAPQHVFASALEQAWSCDLTSAAAGCKVPALYIQAVWPRPELELLGELCPQLVIGRTVGAGHFNMLEVPEQVNAMIERFLAVSLPRPVGQT